jgi:hypothetical protein
MFPLIAFVNAKDIGNPGPNARHAAIKLELAFFICSFLLASMIYIQQSIGDQMKAKLLLGT